MTPPPTHSSRERPMRLRPRYLVLPAAVTMAILACGRDDSRTAGRAGTGIESMPVAPPAPPPALQESEARDAAVGFGSIAGNMAKSASPPSAEQSAGPNAVRLSAPSDAASRAAEGMVIRTGQASVQVRWTPDEDGKCAPGNG